MCLRPLCCPLGHEIVEHTSDAAEMCAQHKFNYVCTHLFVLIASVRSSE